VRTRCREGSFRSESANCGASGWNLLTGPEQPLAVAVTGRIASGKSTIARLVAERLGATLLVADRIREEAVADLARDGSPGDARLRALEHSVDDAVYAELLRRAEGELAAGRSVVLDAAFPERALRSAARGLAARQGACFRLVECRAGAASVRERLAARAAEAGVALGRWLALRDALDARFEPPEELPAAECLRLDTSRPAAASAGAAVRWLAPARGG
jgi:predicted kinase